MDNKEYVFEEGCMWEGSPWKISMDEECDKNGGGKPCKHSRNFRTEKVLKTYSTEEYRIKTVWNCDVVIAYNEGDYNSTGVCLWCILEAVDSLGLRK